jgi:O-antigen/teichoic acid export membrane protein
MGILLSTLITNLVVGVPALIWMLKRVGLHINKEALTDLRRFGFAYQVGTVATFLLQFGDRFFLEASRGLAVVGVYGFAYQFGFLVDQLATGPYMRAWEPRRFARAHQPRAEREQADNAEFHTLTLAVVTLGVGITLFVRPGLRVISSPEFFSAAYMVPIIVLAFVMQAWSAVVHFGMDAAEKPKYASYVMWISAATVIGLYALLIPRYGAWGAAFATLLSFILRTVLMNRFAQHVWPQTYHWGTHLVILGIGIVACGLAWLAPVTGFWPELGVGIAAFALYVAGIALFAPPRQGWSSFRSQWRR